MDVQKRYTQASLKTADNLRSVARSPSVQTLSRLSLPQIDAVVDQVAQVVPAGNVPSVILNGLARLSGRRLPLDTVRRDIDLMFKGVEQVLDKAVYSAVFAGPAAVIWGYQNLLKLVGKSPEDAFPEGIWQFYVNYALREDTARHANETHGFDTILSQHQIRLSAVDRLTAWTMAAIHCLHQYNDLLENEWRERVSLYLLAELTQNEPDAARYARLQREWATRRPYSRGRDDVAPEATYPVYRRHKFDQFLAEATRELRPELREQWTRQIQAVEAADLPAYQQQMSILAYLNPGSYGETRTPIPLKQAHVGLISQGHYYLFPASQPETGQPADVATVRGQIAALLKFPVDTPAAHLAAMTRIKRAGLAELRKSLNPDLLRELDTLRLVPILLNGDLRSRGLPLAELRQAERGLGNHALTIFDTGETFVFDQSHIFFDGAWGAALAEILTNEALSWAVYLRTLPPAQVGQTRPYSPAFQFLETEQELIRQAPQATPEVSVESEAVRLEPMLKLRQRFKQRNDLLQLTVNDLLVLYRAIHAATYQPDPELLTELEELAGQESTRQAAQAALLSIEESKEMNPAMVIPVDASQRDPRERLYPMTFAVPLADLNFISQHQQVTEALDTYKNATGDRTALYAKFNKRQRTYLATLAGFGEVMSKTKEIAITGESASVGTIKLLAHMPTPLQRLLDDVPGRFDILNDIIKGREVVSNVGAVAPKSTLTRFITAKDDNEKKTLAWGIITDAKGVMRISLRDFRPHVRLLKAAGQKELAARIVQDYLDAYAHGLNHYIQDLLKITEASRETRFEKLEGDSG